MPEDKVKNVVMASSPRRCFFPIPFSRLDTPRPKVTDNRRTRLLGKNLRIRLLFQRFLSLVCPQVTTSGLLSPFEEKQMLEGSW